VIFAAYLDRVAQGIALAKDEHISILETACTDAADLQHIAKIRDIVLVRPHL
jgi:hypothetical protein